LQHQGAEFDWISICPADQTVQQTKHGEGMIVAVERQVAFEALQMLLAVFVIAKDLILGKV
jgi:hypothetical protein